jgi:hypothetical protein
MQLDQAVAPSSEPYTATRSDGWTADRQRSFLTALSEGHTVESACRIVGLSVASAYALRRRPAGVVFALGWRAACLMARDRLVDVLMSRAIEGQVDTYTRADGETVTRHRFDNRLAAAMLARLDRLAERDGGSAAPDDDAARLVAQDWTRFSGLLRDDASAADLGVYLATRRLPAAIDGEPQLPQLSPLDGDEPDGAAAADGDGIEDEPVWHDDVRGALVTYFPPPPGFDGDEEGVYTDADYRRTLTAREEAAYHARRAEEIAALIAEDAPDRDAWFGFAPEDGEAAATRH